MWRRVTSSRETREKPFFLYLSHYAVHTELAAKLELLAKYQKKLAALSPDEAAKGWHEARARGHDGECG